MKKIALLNGPVLCDDACLIGFPAVSMIKKKRWKTKKEGGGKQNKEEKEEGAQRRGERASERSE